MNAHNQVPPQKIYITVKAEYSYSNAPVDAIRESIAVLLKAYGLQAVEIGYAPPEVFGQQRVDSLLAKLAECYRLTGADPDGDDNFHLAMRAVYEVRRLREERDEAVGA